MRYKYNTRNKRRKTERYVFGCNSATVMSVARPFLSFLFTCAVRNGVQALVQADLAKSPPTCPVALPPKPVGKTVPCDRSEAVPLIPMQLVMAAAQTWALGPVNTSRC